MENKVKFTVTDLAPNVWQIHEEGAGQWVDCYLIVGEKRAALVDSLMSRGDRRLYDIVRERTSLPVVVLHTHGHGDHVGAELREFIDAGCEVCVSEKDFPLMGGFGAKYPTEIFTKLKDGDRFDLGGRTLEVIELAGHTPGSVAFLDRENRQLFSGDTIGSGSIWMQLDHSTDLTTFLDGMKRLESMVAGLDNLMVYPGHRNQSPVQLNERYITDMRELAEMLVSGEMVGDPMQPAEGGARFPTALVARYGMVGALVYEPSKLK